MNLHRPIACPVTLRRVAGHLTSAVIGLSLVLHVALLADDLSAAGSFLGPDRNKITPEITCRSYRRAMKTHLDYCREWLEQGDAKSLRATAGSLRLLTRLADYRHRSPDWNRACRTFLAACDELCQFAAQSELEASRKALAELDRIHQVLVKIPASVDQTGGDSGTGKGKPTPATPPGSSLKSWMTLMEGLHTDAKAAISLGEPQAAKDYAVILNDIATIISAAGSGKNWKLDSGRLGETSRQAALFNTNDGTALRKQFRLIRSDCRRCHERR